MMMAVAIVIAVVRLIVINNIIYLNVAPQQSCQLITDSA
jgi:hypothetical protein